ncbi:MAG: NADH:ubiquinone reductase (Na(+)-transporting) subunit A [Rhabdochlamydiaceae bacterium]|nr:NADH:ubiquinone reductase (Na(+)-transporting) subunit A [Candidatus Amphrikana amoebophyrae]
MAFIKIKAGFDIPIKGSPKGEPRTITSDSRVAIDLSCFDDIKLKLLVKVGELVKIGDPIAMDKLLNKRVFISHTSGTIIEIIRGEKRRVLYVVVQPDGKDEALKLDPFKLKKATKEKVIERLLVGGAFTFIRKRPCDTLANPTKLPRTIFLQGLESAPFRPDPIMHINGFEEEFQTGLQALEKIVAGNVHLVTRPESKLAYYADDVNIHSHSAVGPHPIANPSIHIEHIDPITNPTDVIWTLHVRDVVKIGALINGKFIHEKVIGIGGEGIDEKDRRYYRIKEGSSLQVLLANKQIKEDCTIISGDPLCGKEVKMDGFIGFFDLALSIIPNSQKREMLHFFRLGKKKFTTTHTYLSGFFQKMSQKFSMNSLIHGEERPFIDGAVYDKVMPLTVPTMPFLKALLEKDYEKAVELGLLEVSAEDFALASFICPSKIDHIGIVDRGLKEYASHYL